MNSFSQSRLLQSLESVAVKSCQKTAVIYQNQAVTYSELYALADLYRHRLHRSSPGSHYVYLYLDKGIELIAAILAVIQSGRAFIPVDANTPLLRLNQILEDVADAFVLTEKRLAANIDSRIPFDCLDQAIEGEDISLPPQKATTDRSSCYAIYTSGSTGRPKGAIISHQALLNVIEQSIADMAIESDSKILQFSSIGFDVSVWEIFTSLLSGSILVIATNEQRYDLDALQTLIHDKAVDTTFFMSTFLTHLQPEQFPTIKTVVTGGEMFGEKIVEQWADDKALFYVYGPTECAIFQSIVRCDNNGSSVPTVGHPIANMRFHLYDVAENEWDVFELGISGIGVGHGYLNREKLTKEKFVQDHQAGVIYLTGDLIKRRPDGEFDFYGRKDRQIKIQGYRVEIGEIEKTILRQPGVESCCVVVVALAQSKLLYAYIVLVADSGVTEASLLDALKEELPGYMIPAQVELMDRLPKNQNGKIDRNQLKAQATETLRNHSTPSSKVLTEHEAILAAYWKKLLKVETVSQEDDFFLLGGTSVLAIRLVAELSGYALKFSDILELRTLAKMAEKMVSFVPVTEAATAVNIQIGKTKSTHTQASIWFACLSSERTDIYDLSYAYQLQGNIDCALLLKTLTTLLNKHESLRTSLRLEGENVLLRVGEANMIRQHDLSGECAEIVHQRVEEALRKPLDIENDIFSAVDVFDTGDEIFLVMKVHHTIYDGWSHDVFLKELESVYLGYCHGDESVAVEGALPVASIYQPKMVTDAEKEDAWLYWRQILSHGAVATVPACTGQTSFPSGHGGQHSRKLDDRLVASIQQFAFDNKQTLFVVLTSLVQLVIRSYSISEQVRLGTVRANREQKAHLHQIGLYAETFLLNNVITEQSSLSHVVSACERNLIESARHDCIPYIELVSEFPSAAIQYWVTVVDPEFEPFHGEASIQWKKLPLQVETNLFDLSFIFESVNNDIYLNLVFARNLYSEDKVSEILARFEQITTCFLEEPETSFSALSENFMFSVRNESAHE
ncbi:amino acid adenylation domain-containing protein [Vibrio rhizosphaerae]|uniref:amino acid adenylation domain-containing protein n=1 Tax=Vibrio rhizosphaerae TaxID=398736 RepID=UPI0005720734|nr:amino acid adenylation domain-containing protein [Vibrio rhizosphaerae]